MGNDKTDQTIKLKDSRTLGYAEYGNPEGQKLVRPHSRLTSQAEAEALWQLRDRSFKWGAPD